MREPLEMATIALVDDDRNILTSVSIALEFAAITRGWLGIPAAPTLLVERCVGRERLIHELAESGA